MYNSLPEFPAENDERIEAARIRDAILEGYRDLLAGRIVSFRGNLRELLNNSNGGATRH